MRSSDEGIRLIFRSENNVSVLPALRFTPRRTTMLCAERAFSCAVPSPSQRSAPIFIPVPCASTCRGRRKGRRHARRFAVTADRDGASAASNTTTPSSSGWHKLNTLWEADEESAMRGELLDLLSPAWRIMLLSDGSVTRHLRLLCPKLQCTQLECVRQGPIGDFASAGGARAMPADVQLIKGELVQREVLLRISEESDGVCGDTCGDADRDEVGDEVGDGTDDANNAKKVGAKKTKTTPAVYAASWWSKNDFATFMTDSQSPMWTNLRTQNVELYREVRMVYYGDNEALGDIFEMRGPFWGRHYIFWHEKKPMCVVYEVFNPRLQKQLGPSEPRRNKTMNTL